MKVAGAALPSVQGQSARLEPAFTRQRGERAALVLLHGWGCDSQIWEGVSRELFEKMNLFAVDVPGHGVNAQFHCSSAEEFCERFFRDIEPLLPARYALLGWSLGGLLAARIAARSGRVTRLVTIASNPVFVGSDHWPGIPAATFAQFKTGLRESGLKGMQRFQLLQCSGTPTARADLRAMQKSCSAPNTVAGSDNAMRDCALQWLADSDYRETYHQIAVPVVHHFGEHDALVPEGVADCIARDYPAHQVRRFSNSAHLPFISERDRWLRAVFEDLGTDSATGTVSVLDKSAVARAFSKAATSYERSAVLQREVGQQLLGKLRATLAEPGRTLRVLDLGSGTGLFARRLRPMLSAAGLAAHIVELDLSEGMLQHSRGQDTVPRNDHSRVLADFELLPFAAQTFDLVHANFSLQWCENFSATLCALAALLREGGELLLSTLADGSLREIGEAWSSLDGGAHINRFCTLAQIEEAVAGSGLQVLSNDAAKLRQGFSSATELLQSVKGIGAGNHRSDRASGLLGVQRYRRFIEALESRRGSDGSLGLAYHVVQLHLRCSHTGG